MNYFRQIYYEMKHQRMMTWVSVSGTALSIFLVMAFIITDNLPNIETAPELNRTRILVGRGFHEESIKKGGNSSAMGISVDLAERIYSGLDGVERISYVTDGQIEEQLSVDGKNDAMGIGKRVDEEFWKIYDFRFLSGKPFDKAQVRANDYVTVLTRSTARKFFGTEDVVGREIEIRMIPARIVGVVDDPNPLMNTSFANFYMIYNKEQYRPYEDDSFGSTNVVLLLKEGVEPQYVKDQVAERYRRLGSEFEKRDKRPVYHGQPYTSTEMSLDFGSNTTPDMENHNLVQVCIYFLLLLLPAINLSSMTRGRLRHRVAEIGVRRAFGARKIDIIRQLLTENFIITLIGGTIGLALSLIFMGYASELFFQFGDEFETNMEIIMARPDFSMLFQWNNFVLALIFCFILNILSATVPAWKASRTEPATALSASR